MQSGLKRLHSEHKKDLFSSLLNAVSVHAYNNLVDLHKNNFICGKCSNLPEDDCYVSIKCAHTFCKMCVKDEPVFDTCPVCNMNLLQEDLIIDTKYWVFYECFRRKNQYACASGKALTVDYLSTVKKPYKYNYLLQEECRKLFNRNPYSPVKNNSEDLENVKLLLNFGANPNVLNKDGWTLMHEAVDYGHSGVLETLLRGGGLVNAYSLDRVSTCLHDALDDDVVNLHIIRLLLEYGADIQARDRSGTTALKKAELKGADLLSLSLSCPKQHCAVKHKPEEMPLLYGSQLPAKKQKLLNDFCQKFKIKQCSRQKVSKEVTHIVVDNDSCKPTFAVLIGILQGCFIVTSKWVEDSLRRDKILLPRAYEVTGTKDWPNTGVPKRARMNAALLQPKLFAGGQFNIHDSIDNMISPEDKEQIAELIAAGGGKLLTRTNSCPESIGESFFYHAHGGPLCYCTVIVLHKTEPLKKGWETIGHFSLRWLYKAIQTFQIVP